MDPQLERLSVGVLSLQIIQFCQLLKREGKRRIIRFEQCFSYRKGILGGLTRIIVSALLDQILSFRQGLFPSFRQYP